MTNFAERLVLRGAGLDTGDATVMLRPRPRHRFEPTSADVVGAIADETESSQEVLSVPATQAEKPAPAPAWNGEKPAPDQGSHADAESAPVGNEPRAQVATERAGRPVATMPPPTDFAASSEPPLGAAPERVQADDTVSEQRFDVSSGKSGEPVWLTRAAPVAPLSGTSSVVEAVSTPAAQRGPSAPHDADVEDTGAVARAPAREEFGKRADVPNDVVPSTEARVEFEGASAHRPARGAFGGLGEATPSYEGLPTTEPSVRPISVSIGRIDVEFAGPPATPPARAGPERTRGFDAYARVRRGLAR